VTNTLKSSKERFLGKVACFFAISREAIEQSENLARSFVHQFLEGSRVASLQSFNELIFNLWPDIGHGRRSNLL
jgi:hypothetical protein